MKSTNCLGKNIDEKREKKLRHLKIELFKEQSSIDKEQENKEKQKKHIIKISYRVWNLTKRKKRKQEMEQIE